jgi:hypothetical protein
MANDTEEIPRESWGPRLDEISRGLGAVEATVEVDGKDLGAQIAAERLLLTGISYDHKDDIAVIALEVPGTDREDYEHLIDHPQRIFVADGVGTPSAIEVEDSEGRKTIVTLEPAPALPGG